jgi:hypothetical protein
MALENFINKDGQIKCRNKEQLYVCKEVVTADTAWFEPTTKDINVFDVYFNSLTINCS